MKQADEITGYGIEARNVGTFMAIAMRAGESKVASDSFSTVLLGDDVVNLKGQRQGKFRHAAVFLSGRPLAFEPFAPVPDSLSSEARLSNEKPPCLGLHHSQENADV